MASANNVVPIRRKPVMPLQSQKAMALLEEAGALLMELVDSGQVEEGSPTAETVGYIDDAIGMLKPFDDEEVHDGK